MLLIDAIKYFSDSDGDRGARLRIAKAVGVTSGAVSQWGEIVPQGQAYKLESLSKGKLKVNPKVYQKNQKAF